MQLIDITILTNIKGLGPVNLLKILNHCREYDINNLFDFKKIDLSKVISPKLAQKINNYLDVDLNNLYENTQQLLDSYTQQGIKCISIVDTNYPTILKESTNPPIILYCKGNIDLLNTHCVAIIGARENTPAGEMITKKTAMFLAKNNFTIVSGLAKGIDSFSHQAALENNANTIAILPLIDKIYPAENKELAQSILNNNGLLLSENKPNSKFNSGQLVKRDRIQSGLSQAVFVIETSINGGSMHATNDALKLKRLVYVPDIYKLDATYQSLKQVQGIKKLIDMKQAISYTDVDYTGIVKQILKFCTKK